MATPDFKSIEVDYFKNKQLLKDIGAQTKEALAATNLSLDIIEFPGGKRLLHSLGLP
jgi:hypothetical protein